MFRVEDGKLVEHWDSDANRASDADGTNMISDRPATNTNREKIELLFANALIPGLYASPESFFANGLVIHRATDQVGANGYFAFLETAQIRYSQLHHIIADGNFVFTLAEGTLAGTAYGFYDLFRLDNGRVVEHWDSRRPVPDSTVSGLPIF